MINKWLKINFGSFALPFSICFFVCTYTSAINTAHLIIMSTYLNNSSLFMTYTYIYVSSCYIKEKKNVSSFFKTKIMNNCQEIVHRKSII